MARPPCPTPRDSGSPVPSALGRAGCQGSCRVQASSPGEARAGEGPTLQTVTCLPCRGTCLTWVSLRIHSGSGRPHRQAGEGGGGLGGWVVCRSSRASRPEGILVSTLGDPETLSRFPCCAASACHLVLREASSAPASGCAPPAWLRHLRSGHACRHHTRDSWGSEVSGYCPRATQLQGGLCPRLPGDRHHADLKVAEACLRLGIESRAGPGRAPEWPTPSHLGNNQEVVFAQCPRSSPHFVSNHVTVRVVTAVSGGDRNDGLLFP